MVNGLRQSKPFSSAHADSRNEVKAKSQFNPWPWAIIGFFAIFIAAITVWVVFAIRHDDQLVRPDYYEHELAFQKQIESTSRAKAIEKEISFAYNVTNQTVQITLPVPLPNSAHPETISGHIQFYRPSDARLDRELPLQLNSAHSQTLDVSGLKEGLWKIHLQWASEGSDYYVERPLFIYN